MYKRRIEAGRIGSTTLARNLAELAHELRREISVLIDRRGRVISVSVADAAGATLPNIRRAENRLSGFHLLHVHTKGGGLSQSDLSTLFMKRLDAVAAIELDKSGQALGVHTAHLTPPNATLEEEDWRILPRVALSRIDDFDLGAQIQALESELSRQSRSRQAKKDCERAILVQISQGEFDAEERLAELAELAKTAGAEVVHKEVIFRRWLKADTLVGAGKLVELTSRAYHLDADMLIFGQELGPAQTREIEKATGLKVIDRTRLILDIFALHAQGVESRLQIEVAQLKYMKPRLVGAGASMSRLGGSGSSAGGGAIGARGPGESKLELDRRSIEKRLSFLEGKLRNVSGHRGERRKSRERNNVPVIGIVGYTNAGKSTLLNALVNAAEQPRRVLAANKLFATLRPTSRQGYLEELGQVVFTDTVGFIRDLPDDLLGSFRATLEEISSADMLLHVLDASAPDAELRFESVLRIFEELDFGHFPMVLALNKSDGVDSQQIELLKARLLERREDLIMVTISALTGQGMNELRQAITDLLHRLERQHLLEQQQAEESRKKAISW